MSDSGGSVRVGCLSALGGVVFGLGAGALGWVWWGWKWGLTSGMAVVGVGLLLSFHSLSRVRELTWGVVMLPFSGGLLYAISPFDIPGPVDDVAVLGAGSLFTLGLAAVKALRANPGVLLPFIAAAIYWLLPNIPGPVDDLLVLVISGGFSIRSARRDGLFLPRPGDEELCPGIEQDVHDGVAADVDQD